MSRVYKIIILIVVFALLVGGYLVVKNNKGSDTTDKNKDVPKAEVVSEINKDDIIHMEVKSDKGTFEFDKKDDKWSFIGHENEDINQDKIEDIARSFSNMKAERVIEADVTAETDLDKYGLKNPSVVATATLKDKSKVTFKLGIKTPDNKNYYIMKEGVNKVYTVWMNHGDYFKYSANDFQNTSLTSINTKNFNYLYIKQKDKDAIEIKTNDSVTQEMAGYGIGLFVLTKPYMKARNIDTTKFDKFLQAVPTFSVDEFIEANPKDLAKYGLDSPETEIILKDKDPETKKVNEIHYLFGKKTDDNKTYFKPADKNVVYTMDTKDVDVFNIDPFEFSEKLIYIVNIQKVDKIEIKPSKGKEYALTFKRETIKKEPKEGEEDKKQEDEIKETFKINGILAEDGPFREVYQNVIGVAADFQISDPENINKNSDDKLTLKYYLEDKTEKTVEYYRYNENFYATEVEPGVYFGCSASQIEKMLSNLALLEKGELKD